MAKIALITDTHFGFKNDSFQFLEYFDKFYERVFFPKLAKAEVDGICHLGDIVDRRKYINYVTLNKFHSMFLERALAYPITVLVGNHDVPYRNTNEVNALSELLRRSKGVRVVSEPTETVFGSCSVLLMPWINSGNYGSCMSAIKETKSQVLFGHLEIKGFEMQRGQPSHDGFDMKVFDKFDVVCSGHFHRKSASGNISYLGAPYELTWADHDDARGFHFFDTETREIEFVKNPYSIYKKLWYNDSNKKLSEVMDIDTDSLRETHVKIIVTEKINPYWFEKYVDLVNGSGAYSVQVVDDHKNADSDIDDEEVERAEDTMTVISGYVNGLGLDGSSKSSLEKLMRDLYEKASKMEETSDSI